ncbi:paraquat-inducible protein A [Desulfocurvus sp. DL9XJH121]
MNAAQGLTAARAGLVACHSCGLLVRDARGEDVEQSCPRCGAALHSRKPDSLARTWAFLITAAILYVPAMAMPIMTTATIQGMRKDTILSGVVYLLTSGMWPLAAIVFFASVVVPILKILTIGYLLVSLRKDDNHRRERTKLYRLTEAVGRWSMVDVYVVTILVALVQLRALALISAEPGAVYFGAVVVLTMFAAMSFDPRLIWDDEVEDIIA